MDAYERFLINKYTSSKTHFADKAKVKDLFFEYYKFLGYFDLQPFVSRIMPFQQRQYDPDGTFYKWYDDATDNLTKSECKEHQKLVINILKGNSKFEQKDFRSHEHGRDFPKTNPRFQVIGVGA